MCISIYIGWYLSNNKEDDELVKNINIVEENTIKSSIDKVYEQAKEYGHSNLREICFLMIHGFLHLLGYDHMETEEEKIMFDRQEEILNGFGITR